MGRLAVEAVEGGGGLVEATLAGGGTKAFGAAGGGVERERVELLLFLRFENVKFLSLDVMGRERALYLKRQILTLFFQV